MENNIDYKIICLLIKDKSKNISCCIIQRDNYFNNYIAREAGLR